MKHVYSLMSYVLFLLIILSINIGSIQNMHCVSNAYAAHIQNPSKPYPYQEQEIFFRNEADDVTLSGTLALPCDQAPSTVVVLVHGSGKLDRNSTIFGHMPFLIWSDYLVRKNIAVLRFDKRGAGKSTGNYNNATLKDFANDVLAAIEYLKSRQNLNCSRIGLIGHSEGGMIAPLVAAKSKDIAFIVLLAAPCVNGQDLYLQRAYQMENNGAHEKTTKQTLELLKSLFMTIASKEDTNKAEIELKEILSKNLKTYTQLQRKIFESYFGNEEEIIKRFNSAWFRYYMTYDPAETLKKVNIPILAIHGDLDQQVSSEQNLMLIKKILEQTKNKDFTIQNLLKHNHILQSCLTGLIDEYTKIDETVSPKVLALVTEWILKKQFKINSYN